MQSCTLFLFFIWHWHWISVTNLMPILIILKRNDCHSDLLHLHLSDLFSLLYVPYCHGFITAGQQLVELLFLGQFTLSTVCFIVFTLPQFLAILDEFDAILSKKFARTWLLQVRALQTFICSLPQSYTRRLRAIDAQGCILTAHLCFLSDHSNELRHEITLRRICIFTCIAVSNN